MAEVPFSVVDEAYERSELPRGPAAECPLGCTGYDLYIYHLLERAGIIVECTGRPQYEAEDPPRMHNTMQIVSGCYISETLENRDKNQIKFRNQLEAEGVQVKLNTGYKWKVTVLEDIAPPPNNKGRSKRARNEEPCKVIQSNHIYEIVVDDNRNKDPIQKLRATYVVGSCLTIVLAFDTNTGDFDGDTVMKEGWPVTNQRRVDMVFTNSCIVTTQVRSVFCVLCSVFCVLLAS